jgi:hypothetical protein
MFRRGESREGSARVGMYLATGLTHCYTLECNYHSSKEIHSIPALPIPVSMASAVAPGARARAATPARATAIVTPVAAPRSMAAAHTVSSTSMAMAAEKGVAVQGSQEQTVAATAMGAEGQTVAPESADEAGGSEATAVPTTTPDGNDSPELLAQVWRECALRIPNFSSSRGPTPSAAPSAPSAAAGAAAVAVGRSKVMDTSRSRPPPMNTVLFSMAPHFDATVPSEVGATEYDVPKMHAMGAAVGHALADMLGIMEGSRVPQSDYRSLATLRSWVQRWLLSRDPKANVGDMLHPHHGGSAVLTSSSSVAGSLSALSLSKGVARPAASMLSRTPSVPTATAAAAAMSSSSMSASRNVRSAGSMGMMGARTLVTTDALSLPTATVSVTDRVASMVGAVASSASLIPRARGSNFSVPAAPSAVPMSVGSTHSAASAGGRPVVTNSSFSFSSLPSASGSKIPRAAAGGHRGKK